MELNRIYNEDCIKGMERLPDGSVDLVLTDPPYLYLKRQKLDRPFDEGAFFSQVKRVLKKDGMIVLFGRGTSFYRWNTMLDDLGFTFKEEIVWDKGYCTSPLMKVSRVHETVSIYTKGKGTINKVKVPYIEMKKHNIGSIISDIKRLKTCFGNRESLEAVKRFFEENQRNSSVEEALDKKSIVRLDRKACETFTKFRVNSDKRKTGNRCVNISQSMEFGMNEKTIIRLDRNDDATVKFGVVRGSCKNGSKVLDVAQSVEFGMNEKTIIKETRDHHTAIHPTQKPARLLERLMSLTSKEGDIVLDPFIGSGSTAIAALNLSRSYIGFEIDKEYHTLASERIYKHTSIVNTRIL